MASYLWRPTYGVLPGVKTVVAAVKATLRVDIWEAVQIQPAPDVLFTLPRVTSDHLSHRVRASTLPA
jgi:hypothetical protein